jgi:hypothetical protein
VLLPSVAREPPGPPPGVVIAVPEGDGAVAVVVPGVLAQPAARLTRKIPCTSSTVLFMRVIPPICLSVGVES